MKIEKYGLHRVKHGNVMDGIDDLMAGELADIVYSDPPWGAGNIKYWQTLNKRQNDLDNYQRRDTPLDDFLTQIFRIASKYSKQWFLCEYGVGWREDIVNMGKAVGFKHLGIADLQYRSGSKLLPLDLHIFAKQNVPLPPNYLQSLKNTHGYKTLQVAVPPLVKQGQIILDPCCGMGYTAQIAIDNGCQFRGNELNRSRLNKTIKRFK